MACNSSVQVVDGDSFLARSNPISETVFRNNTLAEMDQLSCLSIKATRAEDDVVVKPEQLIAFDKALTAFLAPLNYPIVENCDSQIQLVVREFDSSNLIIASRFTIDIQGQVIDLKGKNFWSAEYRMSENAGSLPLDPISAGAGIVTAQKNTSKQSMDDGIYVAVRRLLLALPEYSFDAEQVDAKIIQASGFQAKIKEADDAQTYTDAMVLWKERRYEEALRVMQKLYNPISMSTLGYRYGLMLEAMGRDFRASEIYSETAISQVRENKNSEALKTLRRLQRMNESTDGAFNTIFEKSINEILILTKQL